MATDPPPPETEAEAGPEPVLQARGVHYRYLDRYPALAGVDLTVHAGDRLALLGANGCGKSTLLKLLDALVFPTAGTVHAFGAPLTDAALADPSANAAFRSRVGFVFQNSDTQVFSPTVRDEIAFGCLQLGLGREETLARVDDMTALLQIADLADRAPHQLSGGQKKRVAIASVLVMNPDVLLFDEPTATLDPRTQHWLIDLLAQLTTAGKTLVLATHDLHLLEHLTTRALVLGEDHTVLADTTPADALADQELLLRANLVHPRDNRTHLRPHR
ncbi:MAG: ABC transporter ATP-binding protein [Dermatophilaceae bacterium]